jgi:hypothetical protein
MGGGLYFYRCKNEIYKFLRKSDKLDDIGVGGFFPTMSNWIKPVYATLDSEICKNCTARIFSECHVHLPNGETRSPSPQSSGETPSHSTKPASGQVAGYSAKAPLSNSLPQAGERTNAKGNPGFLGEEANEKGNFLTPANRGQHE